MTTLALLPCRVQVLSPHFSPQGAPSSPFWGSLSQCPRGLFYSDWLLSFDFQGALPHFGQMGESRVGSTLLAHCFPAWPTGGG